MEEKVKEELALPPEPNNSKRTKIESSDETGRARRKVKFKSGFCKKCGAWYGQLGLEPSLDMYIEHLLEIMRELKRVLKKTGVIFWVHGDCYGGSGCGRGDYRNNNKRSLSNPNLYCEKPNPHSKLTPKCMALQNFRFIIRCVDELGLILRNVIIWHKPNHMPESVKDRFTSAYEPVFMLTKSKKYWFDLDAVREPHKEVSKQRVMRAVSNSHKYINHPEYGGGGGINKPRPNRRTKIPADAAELFGSPRVRYHREQNMRISQYQYAEGDYLVVNLHPLGKNPGDVWELSTEPFHDAHFAVFPTKLVERMIKVGCPQEICKKCGKPRERIVERGEFVRTGGKRVKDTPAVSERQKREGTGYHQLFMVGWTDCGCNAGWESGVVLDPFLGSGTTALVALKLGRRFVGIEINREYCEMALRRIEPYLKQRRLEDFAKL